MVPVHLLPVELPPPTTEPLLSCQAVLQARPNSKPGHCVNWETTTAQEGLCVPFPSLWCLQHSSQKPVLPAQLKQLWDSRNQDWRGKEKRWAPFIQHCHLENEWDTTGSFQFIIRALNIDRHHSARTAITAWISKRKKSFKLRWKSLAQR